MPGRAPFEYVVLRIMPRVDRGEFINAGVMLICRPHAFLGARTLFEPDRVQSLDPSLTPIELDAIGEQLAQLCAIAHGDAAANPLAGLSMNERWHLLSAPASTVLQPSPVHTGLCLDPAAELDDLFVALVARTDPETADRLLEK